MIASGEWPDGYLIKISEIEIEFDVCRETVRRALRGLKASGMVTSHSNVGFVVGDKITNEHLRTSIKKNSFFFERR